MGGKRTAWLAWTVCGVVTCLAVVLYWSVSRTQDESRHALLDVYDALVLLLAPGVFAVVAALIVSRQPRNTIGWLLLMPVGLVLVSGPMEGYLQRLAPTDLTPTPALMFVVWFVGWNWLLLIVPLLLIPLLFPNGRPPTPRWRWVTVAVLVWAALFVLLWTLSRQFNPDSTGDLVFDNPIGVLDAETGEALTGVWIIGLLTLVVLCVASLFVRYRRALDTERQQIKWLMYACAVFLVVYVGGTLGGIAGEPNLAGAIWSLSFGLSFMSIPVAIGIAILQHRLFDIDVVIRRTLVYGALTGALLALYLGSVVLLQQVFRVVTGQTSELAIIISTLVIAALFQPLRHWLQGVIDHAFYRRKYDAAHTLTAFSVHLRDEVDLPTLSSELVTVVRETMQPSHLSLWVRPSFSLPRSITPATDEE